MDFIYTTQLINIRLHGGKTKITNNIHKYKKSEDTIKSYKINFMVLILEENISISVLTDTHKGRIFLNIHIRGLQIKKLLTLCATFRCMKGKQFQYV